jgi:hypothetical protein
MKVRSLGHTGSIGHHSNAAFGVRHGGILIASPSSQARSSDITDAREFISRCRFSAKVLQGAPGLRNTPRQSRRWESDPLPLQRAISRSVWAHTASVNSRQRARSRRALVAATARMMRRSLTPSIYDAICGATISPATTPGSRITARTAGPNQARMKRVRSTVIDR